MRNIFCSFSDLTNEASVEAWFINPLLEYLGYNAKDIKLKTSLKKIKVGKGSKAGLYRPDYILSIGSYPSIVIDAKSPTEDISNWTLQCSSYCLELNKLYQHNPVEYYVICNGSSTAVYKWDSNAPLVELEFLDFTTQNQKFIQLTNILERQTVKKLSDSKQRAIAESSFRFEPVSLDEISRLFNKLHNYIWRTERKTPSAAFQELIKIVFIKIKKDREIYDRLGSQPSPKVKDVVFSVHWIKAQTETDNPVNDPLFKNLVRDLEKEIRDRDKKRIFDVNV